MTLISAADFRNNTATTLNRVAYGKEHILLGRRGKPIAAIIPVEELKLLEKLLERYEDQVDIDAADKALKEAKTKGEKALRREDVKKSLGL